MAPPNTACTRLALRARGGYGNNLPILREHIADESVDLIYLDPQLVAEAVDRGQGVVEFEGRPALGDKPCV